MKWAPTSKPLMPKFSKLDPIKGFQKIFSKNSLVELLKSLIKIFIIGYMSYDFLIEEISVIFLFYDIELLPVVQLLGKLDIHIQITMIHRFHLNGEFAFCL